MLMFIITGAVLAEALQAMINTVIKDMDLVRSGGEALPTSSYISLFLRYAIRAIIVLILAGKLNIPVGDPWGAILNTAVFMLLLYVASFVIEVAVRTLVFTVIMMLRRKKDKEDTEQ